MKFTYEFTLEGPEHCPKTSKEMFGSVDAYNSDFPIDVWARESFHMMVQDARSQCLWLQMKCCEQKTESEKQLYAYLEKKIAIYDKIESTVKLTKSE